MLACKAQLATDDELRDLREQVKRLEREKKKPRVRKKIVVQFDESGDESEDGNWQRELALIEKRNEKKLLGEH